MRVEAKQKVLITSKDGQSASADWANFDVKANTVLLGGHVVVMRGKDMAEGPRLKIDLTTGMYRFELEERRRGSRGPAACRGAAAPPRRPVRRSRRQARTCPPGKQCMLFYPKEAKDKAKRRSSRRCHSPMRAGRRAIDASRRKPVMPACSPVHPCTLGCRDEAVSLPARKGNARRTAARVGNGHGEAELDEDETYRRRRLAQHAIDVKKSYRSRMVVKGVCLAAGRGEAVGLLGPNGAGKTTVFYMIMGLVAADAGRVTLDGRDVTRLPMYRRARLGIGYLPQEPSIFRGLSTSRTSWRCWSWSSPTASGARSS